MYRIVVKALEGTSRAVFMEVADMTTKAEAALCVVVSCRCCMAPLPQVVVGSVDVTVPRGAAEDVSDEQAPA